MYMEKEKKKKTMAKFLIIKQDEEDLFYNFFTQARQQSP